MDRGSSSTVDSSHDVGRMPSREGPRINQGETFALRSLVQILSRSEHGGHALRRDTHGRVARSSCRLQLGWNARSLAITIPSHDSPEEVESDGLGFQANPRGVQGSKP
jgi:hypothetical protein